MIQFFRKIRQKLLTENKFTKYLIYAIGEIFLVVIGILIALQINNRNEFLKNREREIVLLKEMKSNLGEDLKDLNYNIKNNKKRIEYNQVIRKVIEDKIPYNDSLESYFGKFFGNFQLVENTSAWENLKSIGLNLISNDSLRNKVSHLYSNKYSYLENLERGLDDNYQWEYLYPQILEHLTIDELWSTGRPRDYENWIQDEKFFEVIKINLMIRGYLQNQYEINSELVQSLIIQIENHLKTLED